MDINIKAYLEAENIPFTIVEDTFLIDIKDTTQEQREVLLTLNIPNAK